MEDESSDSLWIQVFSLLPWTPITKKSFFWRSLIIWSKQSASCWRTRTALLMLFLLMKFCWQNKVLFCTRIYQCRRLTLAKWSEVSKRLLTGPLPVKSTLPLQTGRKRVSTSCRLLLRLPFYATAEDTNMFSIDRMLSRLSIIDSHLKSIESSSRCARRGGSGSRLTSLPYSVIYSAGSAVRQPIYLSTARHYLKVSRGGWSMNYSSRILPMPIALSCKMGPLSQLLSISGRLCCLSYSKVFLGQSWQHFPAASLPALPALCSALALLTGITVSMSSMRWLSKVRTLMKPQSTTYRTPGIVTLVSAMLVERMTLLSQCPGLRSKTWCWYSCGSAEQSMRTSSCPMLKSLLVFQRRFCRPTISSSPVRKTRMSPGGSVKWICMTALKTASQQLSTGSSKLYISVSYDRPSMVIRASVLQNCMNLLDQIVADIMISLKGFQPFRWVASLRLRIAIRTSVLMLLSWAQSRMKRSQEKPIISSLIAIPSVAKTTLVSADRFSSKRTLQPICLPIWCPIQKATLQARVMALILLG